MTAKLGIMLDCSRNSVLSVQTLKKFIDCMAKMGYESLQLYTEDTYEVQGEPYFGYMRGRYTKQELKEIDAYASKKGVELVPCIQTLAHLNAVFRWKKYEKLNDVDDILNVGREETYALIENIFSTLAECFTSRRVNIGMDEAYQLGLGKYLAENGYESKTEILLKHLKKVCAIAGKYGFKPMMWGDMFLRAAFGENRLYGKKVDESKLVPTRKEIPENLSLVYWDYYSTERENYEVMTKYYQLLSDRILFAGGAWRWIGFAPSNKYTLRAMQAAVPVMQNRKIPEIIYTMWGDNGAECSPFTLLPALFAGAEYARGNYDDAGIAEKFEKTFGVAFDDFLLLDLPNDVGVKKSPVANPCKYFLYNDVFLGLYDSAVPDGAGKKYAEHAEKLKKAGKRAGEYAYLFETLASLCDVLATKAELGKKTYRAYREGNRAALQALLDDYDAAIKGCEAFYGAFCAQWEKESKSFGFEVQDVRLGGLIMRCRHCRSRLQDYLEGRISCIDELEQERLSVTDGESEEGELICCNSWSGTVSACPL